MTYRANRAFERAFYDTAAEIIRVSESGGYTKTRTREKLGEIAADIQPVSGELAREEYGLDYSRAMHMFCADNALIVPGVYIKTGDGEYIVRHTARRRLGMTALLEAAEID